MIAAGLAAAGTIGASIYNSIEQKNAEKRQYKYNVNLANVEQGLGKDMWDYTNYENQRKHLENAGLNAALMYGQGGGGGGR